MARRLEDLRTPADAGSEFSSAAEVDHALAVGVDITLLVANLRLAPYERIRKHMQHARFRTEAQTRTVPARVLAKLERLRLEEKVRAWGLNLDQVLDPDAD